MGIFIVIAIICIIVYFVKKDKIEQRRIKYENILKDIEEANRTKQQQILNESQRSNLIELANLVSETIKKNQKYITPDQLMLVENKIKKCISTNDFADLYRLYQILEKTNSDSIHDDMKCFLK